MNSPLISRKHDRIHEILVDYNIYTFYHDVNFWVFYIWVISIVIFFKEKSMYKNYVKSYNRPGAAPRQKLNEVQNYMTLA